MIVLILITLVTIISYYLLKQNYRYWEKREIAGPKPTFLIGNLGKSFILKAAPGEIFNEIYNKYQNEQVVGIYRVATPMLLIRDPEIVKEVMVKSFSHFRDNDIEIDKKNDPIFGRHPFVLKGEEWKMVRGQLTPAFTSGKMKWLYPILEGIASNIVKFLENRPEATNGQGFEAKELCTRFTLNNVASCAFGLEGKCFEEENSEFRQLAKDFLSPGSWTVIWFFLLTICPPLSKLIPLRFVSKKVENKIVDIVTQTLKYREENNVVRNDFLQILSQLKKTCRDYDFTDIDVTAHAAAFFGDGYESSSAVMSFVLFQLASNSEAQAKLRDEVRKSFEENGNKLPYEALQELTYLDAVINETLRSIPNGSLQKMCTSTFQCTLRNSKSLVIEKGTPIVLPISGLHNDPKFYDQPETFKPERFIGKNRENLTKYTFLPFGEGPRACLGQRFGLLQIKAGVAYIIINYYLSVNRKTQQPIKYDPTNIVPTPIGGFWLDFRKVE